MRTSRKQFLKTGALVTTGLIFNNSSIQAGYHKLAQISNEAMLYTLPKLTYSYNSLMPFIDAKTMEIHHGKHHQTYVTKLNEALAKNHELQGHKIEHLLAHLNQIPEQIRTAVRNNGGGHYNHSLFWQLLAPNIKPSEKLQSILAEQFGTFEDFRKQIEKAALSQFGSGWVWLIKTNDKLQITTTPNQDNPLMDIALVKGKPLLALDVWEHAYYLNYQNKRADYITAFWNIVNWQKVEELLHT